MKKLLFFTGALLHFHTAAFGAPAADPFILAQEEKAHIVVNNRILTRINDKAISVMDLMKKLDVLFYREFPQYTSSKVARFQFYQANWKSVLQELIDKELILADAEENKLPISNGDVRQEMEQLFGPNIIANLDKAGLTFDDAWKIVQGDITIRRMMYMRVNSKAIRDVTPQNVWDTYEEHVKQIVRPDEWTYRVISIRAKNQEDGAVAANLAYTLLTDHSTTLEQLPAALKALPNAKDVQVNVSEEFHHMDKEVSDNYKASLSKLENKQYSSPIAQKSRDNSTVFRIFFLDEHFVGGPISFQEAEPRVKDKLIEMAIGKETEAYLNKLRKHFALHQDEIAQLTASDFQPFVLKEN